MIDVEPRIAKLPPKKLIGKHLRMSLAHNRTFELWSSFMPRRKEIKNTLGTDLFSMQVFDSNLNFADFNTDTEFEKWAAVEVADFSEVPYGMEPYTIGGGLYAVFNHIGPASEGHKTFGYIFGKWLPASDYEVDQREHFELLGVKYKNNEPDSEEEVWIPVKVKSRKQINKTTNIL